MENFVIMNMVHNLLKKRENREKFTVCIVGCGKKGLFQACLFAEAGFKVIGVDKNHKIIEMVRKGKSPFEEPDLTEKIKKYVEERRLTVTTNGREAASKSDIIILAVNTEIDEKFRLDYSNIERACEELAKGLRQGSLFIVTSTVAPGITETLVKEKLEENSGLKAGRDFGLAFSPAYAPAKNFHDMMNYIRIVGGIDHKSLEVARSVLETIIKTRTISVSNIKTAEAIELFQNVYFNINVALANELSIFCEKIGIDYLEAQKIANINSNCHLLTPKLLGGRMLNNSYILTESAEELNVKLQVIKTARKVNENMIKHIIQLLKEAFKEIGKPFRRARITILGISCKPNIKELRSSGTLKIVRMLIEKGIKVKVYDPYLKRREMAELECPVESSLKKAVKWADCLLITVGHEQFRKLNLKELKTMMRNPPAIIDLAHVIDPQKAKKEGIFLKSLGRGNF